MRSIKGLVASIMGKRKKTLNTKYLSHIPKNKGFTLIELMVAISIVAILSTIGMVMFSSAQGTARDAKRKGDLRDIVKALEIYKTNNGKYPDPTYGSRGGWGDSDLTPATYIVAMSSYFKGGALPLDPKNDATYHYSYYRYQPSYGCDKGIFYVVGIKKLEAGTRNPVGWKCSGRDWTQEFDEVVGEYE